MTSPNERISKKLRDDMKKVMEKRVKSGLMSLKEARMPEATELLTRTEGYQQSLKELEFKPKREKLK